MSLATFNDSLTAIRNTFAFIRSVSDDVFSLIDLAEAALPNGRGKEKLQFVESLLREAVAAAGIAVDIFEKAWPLINLIINAIVASKKSGPVQTVGGGPGEEQPGPGAGPK
ncbi:MAG: hypothetical protein JNM52_10995 [Betaproteobacteria bacterium]|nr:hypothetical protein [Betaproteobacteria bacterium]